MKRDDDEDLPIDQAMKHEAEAQQERFHSHGKQPTGIQAAAAAAGQPSCCLLKNCR
ncbi:MAG TPA: hypothetical protein VLC51_11465 [Nitrospira sp.]|jgi:hypothetical protein|nr:hypothetical protein [Nitrospira sp.]